jgi:hypothetical protein
MMRFIAICLFLIVPLMWSVAGHTACSAAPVGTANDPVLQMRLNGDSEAGLGPANSLTSTEEGAIVWDDANNTLVACNGSSWIQLQKKLPVACSSGQKLNWNGSQWTCI